MAYCRKCGEIIDDEAVICPKCGVQQRDVKQIEDSGSILYAILGFFIPPIGILLWIIWAGVKPNSAKMAGYGVLAFVGVVVVIFLLTLVINVVR